MYRVVAARVGSRQEAEDLTQEVFARALGRLDGYRSTSGSFRPYLLTVARNLLRDRWRTHRRRGHEDADLTLLPSEDAGPEEATIAAGERAALAAGLAQLPDRHRQVLRLRLLEGRSAAEVAAMLGRTPESVRQLQHRALVELRAALEERDERRIGGG